MSDSWSKSCGLGPLRHTFLNSLLCSLFHMTILLADDGIVYVTDTVVVMRGYCCCVCFGRFGCILVLLVRNILNFFSNKSTGDFVCFGLLSLLLLLLLSVMVNSV